MSKLLDIKLKNLPTKSDVEGLKQDNDDNARLKDEVISLRSDREADKRTINMLLAQQKKKNVVVKGLKVDKNCKLAVKTLVEEKLQLNGSRVSDVRKLNEWDCKMMVLVDCESQGEEENILKNGHKLRGSQVFLDKDLAVEKQASKVALLELKKFLLAIRRETKVKVQNDSINVDGNWMSFNNNKVFMWQRKPAESRLKEVYGNSLEMYHITNAFPSQKSKSKKEERYSRVPKGTERKLRYASRKESLKCATHP